MVISVCKTSDDERYSLEVEDNTCIDSLCKLLDITRDEIAIEDGDLECEVIPAGTKVVISSFKQENVSEVIAKEGEDVSTDEDLDPTFDLDDDHDQSIETIETNEKNETISWSRFPKN